MNGLLEDNLSLLLTYKKYLSLILPADTESVTTVTSCDTDLRLSDLTMTLSEFCSLDGDPTICNLLRVIQTESPSLASLLIKRSDSEFLALIGPLSLPIVCYPEKSMVAV